MDRRQFLQSASIAGMSLAACGLGNVRSARACGDGGGRKGFDYKIAFVRMDQ